MSTADPQIRRAQKSGDRYDITVNLNTLIRQQRLQPQQPHPVDTLRKTSSMLDLTNVKNPPDDHEPMTTVVQVRPDDDRPTLQRRPQPTTLPDPRNPKKTPRKPSANTLTIPPPRTPPSRPRSRSANRPPNTPDVGFDVEVAERHHHVDQVDTHTSTSSTTMTTTRQKSLLIESVKPSPRPTSAFSTLPHTYSMTLNQCMSMSYNPSRDEVADIQHHQHDTATVLDHHTSDVDSARAARHDYIAPSQLTPERTPSRHSDRPPSPLAERPVAVTRLAPAETANPEKVMVNSATQMAVNKSTQMSTKPSDDDSEVSEPENWKKKPFVHTPNDAAQPQMISRSTQMAVNKSTQMDKRYHDDTDSSADSSVRGGKKPKSFLAPSSDKPTPKKKKEKSTTATLR